MSLTHLQHLRESRGWSRAELARRASLNATTVGLIECRRLVPYAGQLRKLARALEVDEDAAEGLVNGDGEAAAP